mgnify:CR=1 FL=1
MKTKPAIIVMELIDGTPTSSTVFSGNRKGENEAKKLFFRLIGEDKKRFGKLASIGELSVAFDKGDYDDGNGYNVVFVNSEYKGY